MTQTIGLGSRADERQRQLGGFDAITDLLKDISTQETARQDKQQLLDFVKLTQGGMSPEEASAQVVSSQPQFDQGLAGIFQKLGAGGANPRSVLNIALKSQLNKPSELDVREQEAGIASTEALTASRTAKTATAKPTAGQRQRDSDIAILKNKKKNESQKREARNRLSASEDLFDMSEVPQDDIDKEFAKITRGFKKLKVKVPGTRLDKMFGEDAFNQGLQDSIDQGLSEGIDPATTEKAFIEWWDRNAADPDPKGFGKEFQQRSAFGKPDIDMNPKSGKPRLTFDTQTKLVTAIGGQKLDTPIDPKFAEGFGKLLIASRSGEISQEEQDTADRVLKSNPERIDEIIKALGL